MKYEFQLSYLDALTKSLEIVKRDADHVNTEMLPLKEQVTSLTSVYMKVDPDKLHESMRKTENDDSVLKNDVAFMIKTYNYQIFPRKFQKSFFDKKRYYRLMKKYKFPVAHLETNWNVNALSSFPTMAFPKELYKFQVEYTHLNVGLPKQIHKYKHFKTEYAVENILCLLPAGQKYGGFVKANLHTWFDGSMDFHTIQITVAHLRSLYFAEIYSNEERLKWFTKLSIKEEDCVLWSQIFDMQFPGYKDIHKLFGQIA